MIKKLFSLFCYAIMAIVVGIMAFRLYTLNHYPAFAEGILPTAAISSSYKNGTLNGITWDLDAEFDNTGDFFIHQPVYFENEKTLFVTVRYNNSLLTEWKHEGSGADLVLDVSLYADGKERIHEADYVYGEAYGIYSYRRYVFEGISLSDYEILYIDIYRDEPDYNTSPYSSVSVYDSSVKTEDYKLTGRDKKALE